MPITRSLLRAALATAFELDARGRILGDGPRFCLAGSAAGNVACVAASVDEATAGRLERLAAEEPPLVRPHAAPVHAESYVKLLGAPDSRSWLCWSFPEDFEYSTTIEVIRSGTPAGDDALEARGDRVYAGWGHAVRGRITAPWCLALHAGAIAAIAETVRSGPDGAECGVSTAPTLRGRGFAAAVIAGWATHPALRGRARFYSTETANRSSQRVVERLELAYLGMRFVVG